MTAETHSQLASFIWSICNLLRGPYKRNEYRKVILPLTVLRRFDCLLAPTKEQVFEELIRIGAEQSNEEADNIAQGDTFTKDGFARDRDGKKWTFTIDGVEKTLVVSKVFDNEDFGFNKITVERPLRLNFQATEERFGRLELGRDASPRRLRTAGTAVPTEDRGETIRRLLGSFGPQQYKDRAKFLDDLKFHCAKVDERLPPAEIKAVLNALGERDETAEICRDRNGDPEPDTDLRDTENVPLKASIEAYFKREVLPHVPDAWIDEKKTKVGYEIPLNRHFYRYEPPRPLEEIHADIRKLEGDIVEMLGEVAR